MSEFSILQINANMRNTIAFHIEGLREDGEAVPEPSSASFFIDVPSAA